MLRDDTRRPAATVRSLPWAEILTGLAFVSGWLLITDGLARLLVPEVWLFSIGLLLLSGGAWRLLSGVAVEGWYGLTRPKPEPKGKRDA